MCDVCCKEFKGWCKSFTRTEAILSALEGALLLLFIGLLAFLILHLLVCYDPHHHDINIITTSSTKLPDSYESTGTIERGKTTASNTHKSHTEIIVITSTKARNNPPQNKECSWTPSKKTKATTRYFEISVSNQTARHASIETTERVIVEIPTVPAEESEGEEPEIVYKSLVLALVKTRPQREVVFGCILTIVSEYWTLTAASCIEAIEELDSLDSFVIMESHGELANGATHAIADVQINPFYQGTNESYDLAALKSDSSLLRRNGKSVLLPSMLDYLLITTGQRLTILGYGNYRTMSKNVSGRRLREVHVYSMPGAQCARRGEEEWWAPRHLWDPAPLGAEQGAGESACAASAICAGGLYARAAPCYYCAGTPLLAGRVLLGVMSGNAQCGVACEPALYVNVAAVRDWLDFVIESD
ncbi:unnamed protein product [Chilo suppressalis]|uniref:Peptidase S1 domain-containing protein n=1 Tax=Chilo suppressalis TaxID=168631 RepID=A0ABN8LBQ4_CHISP|nr:unnamed protein product [Chilo suppressalis]